MRSNLNIVAAIAGESVVPIIITMILGMIFYGIETNALNSFVIGLGTGLGIFLLDNGIIKKIQTTLNTAWMALKDAFRQSEENL